MSLKSPAEIQTQTWIDDGSLVVNRVQDVEDIIERNKKLQNEPQSRKSSFRHIASIPNIFIERWLSEEYARGNTTIKMIGPEMDALVARKLADPDWKWLRTS